MFRIIFGLTLSTICGLFICVAFISFAGDNINQSQLGGMILGSLVLNGVPGWLLCYSGGQSLKSKKVLKASLKMLQDDNSIDVDKISSLTGRNKSKTIKDIKRGQEKGIIPKDIEIIASSEIVEDKWLNKSYVALDNNQSTEVIQAKKIIVKHFIITSISLFTLIFVSNFLLIFIGYFFYGGLFEFEFLLLVFSSLKSIFFAIPISMCVYFREKILIFLRLPINIYTIYVSEVLHILVVLCAFASILAPLLNFLRTPLIQIFFIAILFPLIEMFINKFANNYFVNKNRFSFNKLVFIYKKTSQELMNEVFSKESSKQISKD